MIKDWVSQKYLKKTVSLKSSFQNARPYPYFELRGFFNKKKLLGLKKEVLKERFERQEKDLFSLSNTKELKHSGSKTIKEFYGFLSSGEFIGLMMRLTGQKHLKSIDMHAHKMVQGDYLLFHDDVIEGRKIAYIVYLCDFKGQDGGKLQLFDVKNPRNPAAQIIPRFGTFACFEVSQKSLHVVEEIMGEKDRVTIGGWFYS